MKRTWLHWLPLFALALSACDDDPKKKNNNNAAPCGNGVAEVDLGEQCDGPDLRGFTCRSLNTGFDGGLLACDSSCHLDTSGCLGCDDACDEPGQTRCNPGGSGVETCGEVESGCLGWINEACPEVFPFCVEAGGEAGCAEACTDECTLDETRCNAGADGLETCVTGIDGCAAWVNTECPQDTPVCSDADGDPACVPMLCADDCPLDEVRCNGTDDGLETCVAGPDGCNSWQNAPCAPATPVCDASGDAPVCILPNGTGESCDDARHVTVPFRTVGLTFTADFVDRDLAFTHASCDVGDDPAGSDAVFEADLTAGETVVFMQGGGLDGQLYVQAPCDGAGACLEALDQAGDDGVEELLFSAPATGTYAFIVAAYDSAPASTRYLIALYRWEDPAELSCDDGFDNDFDDAADCVDPDCFGVAGMCDTETDCGDGLDNDADGDLDCSDADCTGLEPCGTEAGQDRCTDGVDNDADGTLDCAQAACAGHEYCPVDLLQEGFDPWPPAGWTILDGGEPTYTWGSSADSSLTLDGATGPFAVVDSDAPELVLNYDESLISPSFSCAGFSSVTLTFIHYYRDYSDDDSASVAISTDDGSSWTPLMTYTATTAFGAPEELSLTAACAGSASARLRFRYVSLWDWYWLIDDVRVTAW